MVKQSPVDIKVEGLSDVRQMLFRLDELYLGKALVNAFRYGAMRILNRARSNARSAGIPRRVIEGMQLRNSRKRGDKRKMVEIGFKKTGSSHPTEGGRRLTTPALASVFEFGTVERRTKRGKPTGRITARPFIRPAVDVGTVECVDVIEKTLVENIQIIVRQLEAKQKVSLAKKFRK